MAFKEVSDLSCEATTALGGFNKKTNQKNPTSVEGYYIGSKVTKSLKSRGGEAKLHVFQTSEGNLGVWGKTDLDRKVSQLQPGTMVRVTVAGMVPTPNGEMYKFKVEQDQSNTIEVNVADSGLSSYTESSTDESSETGLDSEDSYTDEVVTSRPSIPSRPATTPTASSQARVQALLSKRRSA